jgi:hypothetical protein
MQTTLVHKNETQFIWTSMTSNEENINDWDDKLNSNLASDLEAAEKFRRSFLQLSSLVSDSIDGFS